MLKKSKSWLCFLFPVLLVYVTAAIAQESIKVVLDGKVLEFDVEPQIIDNRTMVPMRFIFEALGATVEWDGANQIITATKGELVVKTTIGFKNIIVDGVMKAIDVAPVIIDDRTLVPVRVVSEALGCDVKWDENALAVYITSLPKVNDKPDNVTDNNTGHIVTDFIHGTNESDSSDGTDNEGNCPCCMSENGECDNPDCPCHDEDTNCICLP